MVDSMASSIAQKLLAKTTVATGPKDNLLTLDVYNKLDSKIVNKIQDIAKLFDVDLANILKGGQYITENFPIIEDFQNGILAINQENLAARVSGVSRSIGSAISNIGTSFQENIQSLPLVNDVFVKVDGIVTQVKNTSYEGLHKVSELISTVVDDKALFSLEDKDAVSGLYIGLIKEASQFNIPNSFKTIVGEISDPDILNTVITQAIPVSIKTSDVRMLESIVDSDDVKLTQLLKTDTIKEFAKKYTQGFGFKVSEALEEFTSLKNTFDKINSQWLTKILPNSEEILDLSQITSASEEFKESSQMFVRRSSGLTEKDQMLGLAMMFGQTTVTDEIKAAFPSWIKGQSTSLDKDFISPTHTNL